MSVVLHEGDCLNVLRSMPDASVDSIVTDPPAGVSFMNREFDDPSTYDVDGDTDREKEALASPVEAPGAGGAPAAPVPAASLASFLERLRAEP